jgi:uncharacterized membrane protein (DUF4010 family)
MDFLDFISPFLRGLLLATGIGTIIGLEREFNTREEPGQLGGIRTFILVVLCGYTVGFLSQYTSHWFGVAALGGFALLMVAAFLVQTQHGKLGLTTPLALILTFLLGLMVSAGYVQEPLALVVVATTVLSLKAQLHRLAARVTNQEWLDFIKFIVIALLVLPMLPNQAFGPEGLLNVRDMGLIAVMVLSISFAGYLLLKFADPQIGILLTGLIGGLFSSTMIAWVFAGKSKERPDLGSALGAGVVLASSVMFVRVWLWVSVFAKPVAGRLLAPLLLMFLISLLPSWKAYRERENRERGPEVSPGNPLDIKNALFFVVLYAGVTLFMYATREYVSEAASYVSGAISGIADIDAITISTARWASATGGVTNQAASIILIAMLSNSLFKMGISALYGAPSIRKPVLTGFGSILVAGVLFLVAWMSGLL